MRMHYEIYSSAMSCGSSGSIEIGPTCICTSHRESKLHFALPTGASPRSSEKKIQNPVMWKISHLPYTGAERGDTVQHRYRMAKEDG